MGKSKEVEIWWKFRENSLISVVFFLRTNRVQYSSGESFSAKAKVTATPDEAKAREFGVRTASFSTQVNSELLSTLPQSGWPWSRAHHPAYCITSDPEKTR